MTTLHVAGSLLASDVGARTLTYRLLPFGEPGRTSAGLVTASAGTITLPTDPGSLVLNMEHDRTRPVGRGAALVEDATGITATFHIAATTAGDDLLAEAAAGLRPGASVELDAVSIRSGALLAGTLVAAGAVVTPAFPSALLVAADTEPETDDETDDPEPETDDGETADADTTTEEDDEMTSPTTAAAPAAAPAALVAAAAAPAAPVTTMAHAARMFAAAGAGDRSPDLLAALSDLTYTALSEVVPPAYIGEAWDQVAYDRQFASLINSAPLTSYKVSGWRWTTAPAGSTWAGDKSAVPSNAAATEPVDWTALRFAGAHDHDRALVDFGDPGYWSSYWARMAASYAKWSDLGCLTALLAGAAPVVPAGTGVVSAIVAGALSVLPEGQATFCVLGEAAYAELVERDPLAFLSGTVSLPDGSGNVGGLTFRAASASSGMPADDVLIGNRNAATFYELGSVPLRVEAQNIALGGIDTGAFGYAVTGVHNAAALAQVTVTQPAP